MTFREMKPSELDEPVSLWAECFGDDESVARDYYRLVGAAGVVAEKDGKIISMMNISPISLKLGEKYIKGGFVYAACTSVRERGKGIFRALNAFAGEYARGREMEFLMLIPANDVLFPMYRSMGYVHEAYSALFADIDGGREANADELYPLYLAKRTGAAFVKSRGLFSYAMSAGDCRAKISGNDFAIYAPDGYIFESTNIVGASGKPKALYKWIGADREIKEKLTVDFFGEDRHI